MVGCSTFLNVQSAGQNLVDLLDALSGLRESHQERSHGLEERKKHPALLEGIRGAVNVFQQSGLDPIQVESLGKKPTPAGLDLTRRGDEQPEGFWRRGPSQIQGHPTLRRHLVEPDIYFGPFRLAAENFLPEGDEELTQDLDLTQEVVGRRQFQFSLRVEVLDPWNNNAKR